MSRTYLRPTGFVDSPFGHDGKVARLAGGLLWFSAVEIIGPGAAELLPVTDMEERLEALGPEAQTAWRNITAPRAPLTVGQRTGAPDQPQVAGIVNVTPDSFSDGGRNQIRRRGGGRAMQWQPRGAAMVDVGGESTRPGQSRYGRGTS
jgi:dihydropteroate synthase